MKRSIIISFLLIAFCAFSYSQTAIDKLRQFNTTKGQQNQAAKAVTPEEVRLEEAWTNTAQQMYENGLSHYHKEEYLEAVSWFRKAAVLGYADAQYQLALCYFKGIGVDLDTSKGVNWLQKSAGNGHLESQYILGAAYLDGEGVKKDLSKSSYWFKRSAEQGYAKSQEALGTCYFNGYGVPKDVSQAAYWYEKAAVQGEEDAQKKLGYLYFLQESYEKAVPWLQKAANRGDANAQCILGGLYMNGLGVSMDYNQALAYFKKAAEQQQEKAALMVELFNRAIVQLSVDNDAGIYVDGEYKGQGKWEGLVWPFGNHVVECRKDRHYTTQRTVNVSAEGNNIFLLSAPTPICGTLTVNTVPAGAMVECDGKYIGSTPLSDDKVIVGNHKITVKKSFFKEEEADVEIAEAQTTVREFTLQSSLPVRITTTPVDAKMSVNGHYYFTPLFANFPEGTYTIDIPRQYNKKGIRARRTTVRLDSLHLSHDIKVKYDNNYDHATFFGVDYDQSLQAVGLNFGSNPGKHFMFELNFFYGLKKSEPVYWINLGNFGRGNVQMLSAEYSHWAADIRLGPTFWCGPFLRISPEVGAQYLRLSENILENYSSESSMVEGGYISTLGSVRLRLSLSQHIGLHVTPEYRLNVSNDKVLPELSSDIDKWVKGFGIKAGLVFYFH